MPPYPRTPALRAILTFAALSALTGTASGQAFDPPSTLADCSRLSRLQLDYLFSSGRAVAIPAGPIRGMALVSPGSPIAGPASRGSRLLWQGKIVDEAGDSAVNRFFGVPSVRSRLRFEPSVYDGAPCLVLDYSQTSHVYRKVRDEVREVGPGLYLGRMYSVDDCPRFRRYFALQLCP